MQAKSAASRALRFADGKSLDDYREDELLRAGIERQFLILGEALGRIRREEPHLASQITDLDKAVGLRNQLAHRFDSIDDAVVWDTLRGPLKKMLSELESLF